MERARLERFRGEDTTLAQIVAGQLEQRGHGVEILDGDAVRNNLTKGLDFSKKDRDENIRRIIQPRSG